MISFLLLAAVTQTTPIQAATRLDSALTATVAENEPGVTMLVIKNGQVAYRGSRGRSNLSTRTSLTTETPIYIASIAKQFTATGIMRLVEQGRLRYDDFLVKYLPELSPFADSVTFRHVLTHTSGLPDYLALMNDSVAGWTNADVLALLQKRGKLEFSPGTRVLYSNSGYNMLATVIERVSRKPYAQFLTDEFFSPLQMKSTGVISSASKSPAAMAQGYMKSGDAWTSSAYEALTYGAGGSYSTIEDLARWDLALASGRIVSDSSLKLASTPATLLSGRPTAWGFGWLAEFEAKGPWADVWYVASIGNFKGYQGILKRIDSRGFTVILLTNRGALPWPLVGLTQDLFAR